MLRCVCVCVEVDLYRSLISGQEKQCNNTQGIKDRKWKECKTAADDLEWQSFVERELLQRTVSRYPHTHTVR